MSHSVMKTCDLCQAPTMHIQPSTSHVLHLLLSIATAGGWLIVWFIVAQNNASQAQCSQCGRQRGLFGSARGGVKLNPKPTPTAPRPTTPPAAGPVVCRTCQNKIQPIDGYCSSCGALL